MIKKSIIILSTIMTLLFLVSCSPKEEIDEPNIPKSFGLDKDVEVYKYIYGNLDKDTMPIGGWGDMPPANFGKIYDNPDLISEANYKLVAESHINTVYGLFVNHSINSDDVYRTLDATSKNNLNYLVRDPQIAGAIEEEDDQTILKTISKYNTYSSYAGNMIVDEPGIVSFDALSKAYKNYQKVAASNNMFYINMMPDYATKNQLLNGATGGPLNDESVTYERYLEEYHSKLKLPYYSFDFYPYVGFELGKMRKGYFEQLSSIRKSSNLNKVPYWVYIQASTWSPTNLRIPYQVEVDYQVATSLVYGAKGIQYFMLYTSMEEGAETFAGGMMDKYGNLNPMYDYVKEINEHLISIDHILMNSRHDGVMQIGSSVQDIPKADLLTEYSVLKNISGGDALVGCYNYNGKPAYYVMNNSFTEETTLDISFNDSVLFNVYNQDKLIKQSGDSYTLTLKPGRGALIELTGFTK